MNKEQNNQNKAPEKPIKPNGEFAFDISAFKTKTAVANCDDQCSIKTNCLSTTDYWCKAKEKAEQLRAKGLNFVFLAHIINDMIVISIDCHLNDARCWCFKVEAIKKMCDLQADKDCPLKFEHWFPAFENASVVPCRKVAFGLDEPKTEGTRGQFEYRPLFLLQD